MKIALTTVNYDFNVFICYKAKLLYKYKFYHKQIFNDTPANNNDKSNI